jgi:hypothetical protein
VIKLLQKCQEGALEQGCHVDEARLEICERKIVRHFEKRISESRMEEAGEDDLLAVLRHRPSSLCSLRGTSK